MYCNPTKTRIILFCLVVFTALCSVSVLAAPVDQLTQLLSRFSTYQASFKQWVVDDQGQLQSQSSGTFAIKRPNQFRWVTRAPDNTWIIANGQTLWHYDVDLAQATRQTLRNGSQSDNPAMLLSSRVNHLAQHFTVSYVKLQGKNWFLLTPKIEQNYKKIYLYFDQDKLTQIIVINNLDNRSLFQFSNVILNRPIADSVFTFKAPRGVDVDVQK